MALSFHHHRLSNGLNVVAEINPDAHTAAVGFFVRTGARDEHPSVMGVSHFLEHMMFKGSHARSADEVNRQFDAMGANYNAFTSEELTVYHAQVLPEFFAAAVELLGDILRPALRQEDFDAEKKVILEEIGMYEDRPFWRLHDALLERAWPDHRLGHRVLGTSRSVASLTAGQMLGYFHSRYSADNITVAAAGRLDFDRLTRDLEAIAGAWRPTHVGRDLSPASIRPGVHRLTDAKLSRSYIAAVCPAPSAQDERRHAAKIVADVLGEADSSRLHWALVEPGLADEASFSLQPMDHAGAFIAYASCDPRRSGQVERLLLRTIDSYAMKIDEQEILRAKNKLATLATLAGERPPGRMQGLGAQWLYTGRYVPLEEELDRLMRVSVADVRALLRDFTFEPRCVVTLGPE